MGKWIAKHIDTILFAFWVICFIGSFVMPIVVLRIAADSL